MQSEAPFVRATQSEAAKCNQKRLLTQSEATGCNQKRLFQERHNQKQSEVPILSPVTDMSFNDKELKHQYPVIASDAPRNILRRSNKRASASA